MKINNPKAYFDYEITDKLEAGINLFGHEVKSLRLGKADLKSSFVRIIGSEAYLVNAKIFAYQPGQIQDYDDTRTRKLLMHKAQIISLKSKADGQGLTLVPLSLYFKNRFIKLEIGLGKGKKKFEKRESIKKRDFQRELEREIR